LRFSWEAMADCPEKHGLKSFQTSTSSYACDICKRKAMSGTKMYGCTECNWNACKSCYKRKQKEKKKGTEFEWEEAFGDLCHRTHTDQAKWFLNGFWHEGMEAKREEVWTFCHHFIEIESGAKVLYGSKRFKLEEKCDLDELESHKFLEILGETLTVKELRQRLKKLDIDSNNRLCLSEYLLSRYNKTPQALVDSPQGGVDPDVLEEAQRKCDAAQELLDKATDAAQTAKDNKNKAKAAADKAAKSLAAAEEAAGAAKVALENSNAKASDAAVALENSEKVAATAADATKAQEKQEKQLAVIQAEVKAAVEALELAEKTYNDKISKLENKLDDPKLSTVKRGSVVAKLAVLKDEDPLPLRKARITQGACLKKQKKISKKAAKATVACQKAQELAEKAAEEATEAKTQADSAAEAAAAAKEEADAAAEAAAAAKEEADAAAQAAEESEKVAQEYVVEAEAAFAEAGDFLSELKKNKEPPKGALWWMERILEEKQKFMPKNKRK